MTTIRGVGYTAFVPTGSWATNTTYSGGYLLRPQAGVVDINASLALTGIPDAVPLTIDLPAGLVLDVGVCPGPSLRFPIGIATLEIGGQRYEAQVVATAADPTRLKIYTLVDTSSTVRVGPTVDQTTPAAFGLGSHIDVVVRGMPVVIP